MDAPRRDLALLWLAALLLAGWFVGGALIWSGGHPMFPLDDAFIHLQAAKQTSQLHFFHYFEGQGFTPATSSPLWTLIEVPGFWLGLKGIRIALWVWAVSLALWLASLTLMYRIAALAAGRGAGLLAGTLFLAHGHLAWSQFSGMETGLFTTLMLLTIHALQRWEEDREERRSFSRWAITGWIAAALLGLTRPEGFGLTLIAAATLSWLAWRGRLNPFHALLWWLAALPSLLWMILLRALAGSWGPNALALKGIFGDPFWSLPEKLRAVGQNWFDFWARLQGNDGSLIWFLREGAAPWVGPFLILFALFGAGPAIIGLHRRRRGTGETAAGLWFLLGTGAVCTSAVAFSHHARYFVAYLPLLIVLAAIGVAEIAGLWRSRGPHVITALGLPLVILALPSVPWWAHVFADNSQDIYEQHRRMGWWLADRSQVPADTRVAVTDTGALAFFNEDLPMQDIAGLGTTRLEPDFPRQATVMRNGLGALWENWERSESRPALIITYPNLWTTHDQPSLWLGDPVMAAATADLSITHGQILTAYRPDWSGVGSGAEPSPALLRFEDAGAWGSDRGAVVDTVDVADLLSEQRHQHEWQFASDRPRHRYHEWPPRFTPLRWMTRADEPDGMVIWDGGRWMSGGESFTLRIEPDRPLRLVGRTDGHWAASIRVRLDGGAPREIRLPSAEGWIEFAIDYPASEVTSATPRVEVEYLWPHGGESHWASYHWWAIQPL